MNPSRPPCYFWENAVTFVRLDWAMTMRRLISVLALGVVLFGGCRKPAVPEEPEPVDVVREGITAIFQNLPSDEQRDAALGEDAYSGKSCGRNRAHPIHQLRQRLH